MEFSPRLQEGVLIRRYKRFLADVELAGGDVITIHCPNTGSMLNCQDSGSRVWYSTSDNPKRKYPCTWELVETHAGDRIGINTGRANSLVEEALRNRVITELQDYQHIQKEVRFGKERSRIDLLLSTADGGGERALPDCYVEVKNVSLGMGGGLGVFPDAVTTRGQKHLRELMSVLEQGYRAVLFFCVQHSGVKRLSPADHIDPEYGRLLRQAAAAGVELLAYRASLSPEVIRLNESLPIVL
ncbi:MAG: DNA/RNA nuclease SfsA [Gammaproteobacteria bacterium]|nr:DNA/RNA nuclease SfsA [Pseudomonadales bacterium]MCP5345510.1 DNA/RNA nuclease SfsA [Pseudomonadales bacterium]